MTLADAVKAEFSTSGDSIQPVKMEIGILFRDIS